MSDYLSRAAERVDGTNAAIRPVLPSLFDPDKGAAENVTAPLSFPEPLSKLEAEHVTHSGEKIASAVSGIQERVASVLALFPKTPAGTQTHRSEPVAKPTFADVPPARARSPSEQALEVNASSTASEVGWEKLSYPERSEMRPSVAGSSSAAEPSAKVKESLPPSRVTRLHVEAQPADKLPPKQPEPVRAKVGELVKRPKVGEPVRKDSPAVIPVTAVPRRRAAGFGPTRAPNPIRSDDRESSSERTIQVTIGRLEVRAVQSAPPATKPAPTKPRVSLEEYLRSRNRGVG
jgi:hypothetical protein